MPLRTEATQAAIVALTLCGLPMLAATSAWSQSPSLTRPELVAALRKGGQVIVMRHASSPRTVPERAAANPDNTEPERQLDEAGRSAATAMGKAIRELKIPVGLVLSSPRYRALETIKLARLPAPRINDALGDGGQSMQAASAPQGQWLLNQVRLLPKGTNTIIVTHLPNISSAFPQYSAGLSDGEALVFGADVAGGVTLLARIKIEEWPALGNDQP